MTDYVKCKGKKYGDCLNCNRYFSTHSLHYDRQKQRKVSEISCSIGGNRYFDEDGNEV